MGIRLVFLAKCYEQGKLRVERYGHLPDGMDASQYKDYVLFTRSLFCSALPRTALDRIEMPPDAIARISVPRRLDGRGGVSVVAAHDAAPTNGGSRAEALAHGVHSADEA